MIDVLLNVVELVLIGVDFGMGSGVIVFVMVIEVFYVWIFVVELFVDVYVWVSCNVVGVENLMFVLVDFDDVFLEFDGEVIVVIFNLFYVLDVVILCDLEVWFFDFVMVFYGGEDGLDVV